MNCEQRRDMMPLLLVDGLEPAEAAALRAHMAGGCVRCASYLAEADATINHLPYALDPVAPGAAARDRLMARIGEVAPERSGAGRGGSGVLRMPLWARRALPPLVAACVALVTTVQVMLYVQGAHDGAYQKQLTDVRQVLASTEHRAQALAVEKQKSDEIARVAYSSNKQIMLEGRGSQAKAFGRAVWDEQRQAWRFRAFNLEPIADRDAYELWFLTPYGRKVPAATFKPDDQGGAYLVVSLPKDIGPVSGAFVTDEPSVGTFQPTGSTHLSGKLE